MKLLAIDSSGLTASVAVTDEERLLGEYTIDHKKTHSETLLPMIDALMQMLELPVSGIDAIAVAAGPGSFTGLRIGAATVKGLGLALSVPIIPVPTVDAMAYAIYGAAGRICPLMDARRNHTYTGLYRFDGDGDFHVLHGQCAVDISEIISCIDESDEPVIFLGDGVPVFSDIIEKNCHAPHRFAPPGYNRQRAAAVAALGRIYYDEGKSVSAADFRPIYLRLSQAERELRALNEGELKTKPEFSAIPTEPLMSSHEVMSEFSSSVERIEAGGTVEEPTA